MPAVPASSNPIADVGDHEPGSSGAESGFALGPYRITARIASGGMATVYRARLDREGGFAREFAIKVIHPHLAAADGFQDRFLDEARVASRVDHPNVVATIDSGEDVGYHYLVLGLVDGVTLRQVQVNDLQRASSGGRLSPEEAARVVCDAARGLHAVHGVADDEGQSMDVVHRDLSPHNLMIDKTGRAVLIDLGLAKSRGQLGHTQTGVLCGKLPYMSPEQSRMDALDARSDVFSLGSVLFELTVGRPPFGDDHTPGTLDKLRKCNTEAVCRQLEAVEAPGWLTQVVASCLRREPEDRCASAQHLADALEEGLRRSSVSESRVRERLAHRVNVVRDRVGPEQPAKPLPALITAPRASFEDGDASGSASGSQWGLSGRWGRGLAMAAAGAGLILIVLAAASFGERRSAKNNQQRRSSPSLATDTVTDTPAKSERAQEPEKTASQPTPPVVAPAAELLDPELDETEGADPELDEIEGAETDAEPPKPRRKRKGKAGALAEFKRNPYD